MHLLKLKDSLIDADLFLKEHAEEEGLSWSEFCDKYGIIDENQERQIRKNEVPLKENA